MHATLATLLLTLFAQTATLAPEKAAVMASVHQFVDAFNKGDTKAAATVCAEETSIIDDFSPHEWHGAGACTKWMNDYDADAKKNGITDGIVKLGPPRHVDVSADRAYVVVPADYTYNKKGKPVKEMGSALTISLQKRASSWQITGWAWSKH